MRKRGEGRTGSKRRRKRKKKLGMRGWGRIYEKAHGGRKERKKSAITER